MVGWVGLESGNGKKWIVAMERKEEVHILCPVVAKVGFMLELIFSSSQRFRWLGTLLRV